MLLYAKFDSDKLENVGVPQIWFIFSHIMSIIAEIRLR